MVETVTKKVAIAISLNLVEGTEALPGSALWVKSLMERGTLVLSAAPVACVFLKHPDIEKTHRLCTFGVDADRPTGEEFLTWPTCDDHYNSQYEGYSLFGHALSRGGFKMVSALAKKSRKLLKVAMRRSDRAGLANGNTITLRITSN